MRLSGQVIHLVGHDLLYQAGERRAVGQVAVVQEHPRVLQVRILVERLDPRRIEAAGAADQAVNLVALGQQQLAQIAAVLTGNAGNESFLRHIHLQ